MARIGDTSLTVDQARRRKQAFDLRAQGLTLDQDGAVMGCSGENVRKLSRQWPRTIGSPRFQAIIKAMNAD